MQNDNKKIDSFRLGANAQSTDKARRLLYELGREDINPIIIGVVGATESQKANFSKDLIHLPGEHENVVALNREYQHNNNKEISERFDKISNDMAIAVEKLNKSLSDCIGAINTLSYKPYTTKKKREGSKAGGHKKSVAKNRKRAKQAKKSRQKNRK